MFMLVKYASQAGISLPEIVFWRQAVPVVLIGGWLAASGQLQRLRTRRLGSHARRTLIGSCAMLSGFVASIMLPLAEATTLGFTSPLFAVLIAALILRERVGPWRCTAVVLGFAGVLIVARPGHVPISNIGTIAGLAAGLLVAVVSYQVRDLSRTEEPTSVVFYFAAFGTVLTLPFLPFYATSHSVSQLALLIAIGLFGTVGQFLLTGALRNGAVASVMVMDYSALIWATLYGLILWDQFPPLATWLGAPAIVAAGLIVAARERHLSKAISPPTAIDLK